ncbi:hypothetical protein M0802_016480, partial [Mischocyttarus mexicanus]
MVDTVQTVLGKVNVTELGRVLTHEHVALDFTDFYTLPPPTLEPFLNKPMKLHNMGWVRQYPYSNMNNIKFNDTESAYAVLEDLKLFHQFGGNTIVENSSHGLKRNIGLMKTLMEKTGVNIIAGTGFYVEKTQDEGTRNSSVEDLYDIIMLEMTDGCQKFDDTKAGFIGEVGTTSPIAGMYFEKNSILATALAQSQLGCPVSFHPGRDSNIPREIMRIYQEAGGDSKKAVMSHLDRTIKFFSLQYQI